MTVFELHWNLQQEINLLSNNNNQGLNDREMDRLLNLAKDDYRDLFFYGKNTKGLEVEGFESNKQKIHMFEGLVFGYPEEEALSNPKELNDNMYSFDFDETKNVFEAYITSTLSTDCGKFAVNISQHNDGLENDFHQKTSKDFKKANGLIRNNKIYFTCIDFKPLKLELTYLKKIKDISSGTYPKIDLAISQTSPSNMAKQECEISEKYHNLLVTIAAQNYMRIYGKQQYNLLKDKINQNT